MAAPSLSERFTRRTFLRGVAGAGAIKLLAACDSPNIQATIDASVEATTTARVPAEPATGERIMSAEERARQDAADRMLAAAMANPPRPVTPPTPEVILRAQLPPADATRIASKEKPNREKDPSIVALSAWINSMRAPQTIQATYAGGLNVPESHLNLKPSDGSLQELEDTLLSGKNPDPEKILSMDWLAWSYFPQNSSGQPIKAYGDIQMKDIHTVTTPVPLSPADRANGLLWKGEAQVKFVSRHREFRIRLNASHNTPNEKIEEWLSRREQEPDNLPFSPWVDDASLLHTITIPQNGIAQAAARNPSRYSFPVIIKPSQRIGTIEYGVLGGCKPEESAYCRNQVEKMG